MLKNGQKALGDGDNRHAQGFLAFFHALVQDG